MSSTPSQQVQSADRKPSYDDLLTTIKQLKARISWFEQQLFGSTSEGRVDVDNPYQLPLADLFSEASPSAAEAQQTQTIQRGKARKQRADDCMTAQGPRFNADVPVEVAEVPAA